MSSTSKIDQSSDTTEVVLEPIEDKKIIGPGKALQEGREKLSLTQKDVAKRLNFRQVLIENIENNNLDPNLSATFNRGYLRSYARLVGVNVDEVLAAFDAHGETKNHRSEMLSFSNLMVKETEKSRLMWVSYIILIILLGSTVLWWLQNEENILEPTNINKLPKKVIIKKKDSVKEDVSNLVTESKEANDTTSADAIPVQINKPEINEPVSMSASSLELVPSTELSTEALLKVSEQAEEAIVGHAIFTFSGDCWVNIYDATGERIAWGVKKTGYVMTIKGQEPLSITLGKPELATILYNDQKVDLSSFNVGNIAKFTLPMTP